MDATCSIFAIDANRYPDLCNNPTAVTNEVILREELGYLALQSRSSPDISEAQLLTEMREKLAAMTTEGGQEERGDIIDYYARIDALVDAALTCGDRKGPFEFESDWYKLNEILIHGEEPDSPAHFLFGGKHIGEDVGYGTPRLQDPDAVRTFSAYLDRWSPAHFIAILEVLARSEDDYIDGFNQLFSTDEAAERKADAEVEAQFRSDEAMVFMRFKAYISEAAAAGCGMLIWKKETPGLDGDEEMTCS